MRKLLWLVLTLICLAAAVISAVMLVMAVRFMEYGRVLFYFTVAIFSIEAGILSLIKLKNNPKQDS